VGLLLDHGTITREELETRAAELVENPEMLQAADLVEKLSQSHMKNRQRLEEKRNREAADRLKPTIPVSRAG
jgi:hypothetical protein